MRPLHIVMQEDLLRDRTIGGLDHKVTTFDTNSDWKRHLGNLDREIDDQFRPIIFASIPVCSFINRNLNSLSRGVVADFELCRFSKSMALAPKGLPLNDSYILLPFGEILRRQEQIYTLFGERIFLRPDDSRKSFSGFSFCIEEIKQELSSLQQIHNIHDDELCVIDGHREFKRSEYRCWLISGRVSTAASYSHYGPTKQNVPQTVLDTASKLALQMEIYNDTAVADFAIKPNGEVALIEINAISTSGIYPGADIDAIIRSLDEILI